jgi:hypothetical protein
MPRAIEPSRDLWPGIASRIEAERQRSARVPPWWRQAVAAVVLVAGSSLLTAAWLERGRVAPATTATTAPAPAAQVVPATYGPAGGLDPDYLKARRQLGLLLQARMATMPASARAKLELNLAEMHRAAEQINAALLQQPGDPLLEELLIKTYQDELMMLANVNQLTGVGKVAAVPAAMERMQL